MSLSFELLQEKNNANPQLVGSIGAADTTIALATGHGTRLPTILAGSATSGGDPRTLNSTGIQAAGVSVGDFIVNETDGSWAIVISVATNSARTTPLRAGGTNTWANTNTWAVGRFAATLTNYDSSGNIVKKERVLVTRHAASADSVTVTRSYGGDTAQTFSASDTLNIFAMEDQFTNIQKAIRESLTEIDEIDRGTHGYAADSGSTNAYAVTLSPVVTSLADIVGKYIIFKATNANTGASTIAVNGLAATAIRKPGGSTALAANDIAAGALVLVCYDGSVFQMLSPSASSTSGNTLFLSPELAKPSASFGCTAVATYTPTTSITLDNNAGPTNAGSSSSVTVSYTTSGSNRILYVGVELFDSGSDLVTGVTYNGVAMTQLGKVNNTPSGRSLYLYSLVNPASGAHNVVISLSSPATVIWNFVSYNGANQVTQPTTGDTTTQASGTTLAATSTKISGNDWLVMYANNNTANFVAGSNTTVRGSLTSRNIFDSNGTNVYTLNASWTGTGAGSAVVAAMSPAGSSPLVRYLDFDQTSFQQAEFQTIMPASYNGGTITAKLVWRSTASTGNVVWRVELLGVADADSLPSVAYGLPQSVTDGSNGANAENITAATAAITPGGNPGADKPMWIRVSRDAANASDTLAANASLVGVELTF